MFLSPTDREKERIWMNKKGGNERSGQNWISFEVIGKEMYSCFIHASIWFNKEHHLIKSHFCSRKKKSFFSSLSPFSSSFDSPSMIDRIELLIWPSANLNPFLVEVTRLRSERNNWRMQWETTFFPDLVTNRCFFPLSPLSLFLSRSLNLNPQVISGHHPSSIRSKHSASSSCLVIRGFHHTFHSSNLTANKYIHTKKLMMVEREKRIMIALCLSLNLCSTSMGKDSFREREREREKRQSFESLGAFLVSFSPVLLKVKFLTFFR